MDLFSTDDFEMENNQKANNKTLKIIIIAIVALLLVIIAIIGTMTYLNSKRMKFYVDGTQKEIKDSYFQINDDGTIYISISEMASLLGIEYNKGEYGKISEDTSKGYVTIKSEDETEYCIFEANSNKIYKKGESDEEKYSYIYLDEPLKYYNNQIYASKDGISKILDIKFEYKKDITIQTLDFLENYYTSIISDFGYKEIDKKFSNRKAMLKNILIVTKEDGKIGIIQVDGKEIAGAKYDDVDFVESTETFIVTRNDKKGIMDINGKTVISLDYSDIKLIDEDAKLYLVQQNDKYGVLKPGTTILHIEFDEIGVEISQYKNENIKNPYLLFDNCIVVRKDEKYGMYNKNGKQLLPIEYDGVGCTVGTRETNSVGNVLTISDYEAIVIKKDEHYGVINSTGTILIPCAMDTVYSRTDNGKITVIIEGKRASGETYSYDIEKYFDAVGIKKVNRNDESSDEYQNIENDNSDESSENNNGDDANNNNNNNVENNEDNSEDNNQDNSDENNEEE